MKNIIYKFMALFFAIALSGCAATQHQQINTINQEYINHIANEPKIKLLEGKILLPPQTHWTLSQLSDTTYPNEQQKNALLAFDAISKKIAQSALQFARSDPSVYPVMEHYYSELQINRVMLYQGSITFGEYNQYAKKIFEVRQDLLENLARISEEQRRNAWANAIQSMSESFQRAATNQTNLINCGINGAFTKCTSK